VFSTLDLVDLAKNRKNFSEALFEIFVVKVETFKEFFLSYKHFPLAIFYRAMLCIRSTSHGPVSVCLSVSVRLSQVGVLLKRLNRG